MCWVRLFFDAESNVTLLRSEIKMAALKSKIAKTISHAHAATVALGFLTRILSSQSADVNINGKEHSHWEKS
jgi:hypothetical protein